MQDISSGTRFELRFRPTAQDYAALLRATKHTWAERLYAFIVPAAYWGLALILTVPLIVYGPARRFLTEHAGHYGPPAVIVAFGLLFWCFHAFFLFPRVIRDTLEGQTIGQGENHITVDDSGIVSRVGGVHSQVPWAAVQRVADSRGCIILFTGRNSGLILPRRIFVAEQEADRLLAFANQKAGGSQ